MTRAVEALPADAELDESDGAPHVPVGRFAVSDGAYFPEGAVIVNLSDAVGTRHHTNASRLNGCCGLDGLDGLNTLCANGHEIGTEKSDCWMPHALLLAPDAVES